jgi:hypothetical protein
VGYRRDYVSSSRLARLFEIGTGECIGWEDSDLKAILADVLDVPLAKWVKLEANLARKEKRAGSLRDGRRITSIRDLLIHPQPPLNYLRAAKEMAKSADSRGSESLPPPVASALYFGMIATALVRHGQKITRMTDLEFRLGLGWVAKQKWIDEFLRKLARDALSALE